MIYEEEVKIITKKKISDGMGGFTEKNSEVGTIYCIVAPFNVSERNILNALNPWTSIKFYTEDEIPLDEDAEFYLVRKTDKTGSELDYDKCIKIVGERYHL